MIRGIFCLLLLNSFILTAQSRTELIDSAKAILAEPRISEEDFISAASLIVKKSDDPAECISYGSLLIPKLVEYDSIELLISTYLYIGVSFRRAGDSENAIRYLYKSAALADSVGNKISETDALYNLASVYKMNHDLETALSIEKETLANYRAMKDTTRVTLAWINISNTYTLLGHYDSAIFSLTNASGFLDKLTVSLRNYALGYLESNAGIAYGKLGKLDTSEYLIDNAINHLMVNESYYPIADSEANMALIFYEYGEPKKAIKYASEAVKLATHHDLKEQIRDGAEVLSRVYYDLRQLDSAYKYQAIYYQTQDSIQNIESVKKAEAERANFEISKKQAEVDLLDAQKQAREQLLMGISVIVVLLLVGTYLIFRSYQTQSRLSQELAEQKLQLEKLNTSKDKLFSILSHDLRGPIAAFSGVSMMIKMAVKQQKTEMLDEIADEVKLSSTKLSDMLENLLTWAVQEQKGFEPKAEPLSVQDLFSDMKGMYLPLAAGKHIALSTPEETDVRILSDKNTTQTIFRNLVNNALKFTPQGGQVTLDCQANGQMAILTVTDTGVGIPEEKMAGLFDFQGQKSSFGTAGEKGLGLGLNLVAEFVKVNNGEISVTSTPGEGTQFTVKLPLA